MDRSIRIYIEVYPDIRIEPSTSWERGHENDAIPLSFEVDRMQGEYWLPTTFLWGTQQTHPHIDETAPQKFQKVYSWHRYMRRRRVSCTTRSKRRQWKSLGSLQRSNDGRHAYSMLSSEHHTSFNIAHTKRQGNNVVVVPATSSFSVPRGRHIEIECTCRPAVLGTCMKP
jgi:hypothetical protein